MHTRTYWYAPTLPIRTYTHDLTHNSGGDYVHKKKIMKTFRNMRRFGDIRAQNYDDIGTTDGISQHVMT